MLSGTDVARIRKARNISQQELAFRADVNKAYVSEYETGVRPELPAPMLARLEAALLEPPAGHTHLRLRKGPSGRTILILRDSDGNLYTPPVASVQWTEADGTTYSVFVGDNQA